MISGSVFSSGVATCECIILVKLVELIWLLGFRKKEVESQKKKPQLLESWQSSFSLLSEIRKKKKGKRFFLFVCFKGFYVFLLLSKSPDRQKRPRTVTGNFFCLFASDHFLLWKKVFTSGQEGCLVEWEQRKQNELYWLSRLAGLILWFVNFLVCTSKSFVFVKCSCNHQRLQNVSVQVVSWKHNGRFEQTQRQRCGVVKPFW